MKRSYLGKVLSLTRWIAKFFNKILKRKRITAADFTKKCGKIFSEVLIQEGSVTIKVFGKIFNLISLKNENLFSLSLTTIWFQGNLNFFFENATRGLEIKENPYIIDT